MNPLGITPRLLLRLLKGNDPWLLPDHETMGAVVQTQRGRNGKGWPRPNASTNSPR